MVQVIKADRGPLIHIHFVERAIHGNGIAIKVYGEMKIAAKEIVYARELKLNTLQVLVLTPETGVHYPFHAQKYIYHKGELDNYASVDIFAWDNYYEMLAGENRGQSGSAPSHLPSDGSLWLDFIALGED
jgi:hypothetical protein